MNQRPDPVAFIDLGAQRRRLGSAIDEAVGRVLTHCQFVSGPEVAKLEADLAAFCGAKHVVACASGTDALLMVLMAKQVGPGDAVLVPSFTFCATGEVVALTGATPVFVDVDEATFNIDVASLKRGIATARKAGLKPKAIIPVDLFGQSADHDAVAKVAAEEGLFVLDDAAQSFGATYKGKRLGTFGLATATSFFPAKPLGCFGDGGAIFTDDAAHAEALRSVRVHGQGSEKYDNIRLGLTGRLDTMQAAILIEKLAILEEEMEARQKVADRYAQGLGDVVKAARNLGHGRSAWAQYAIETPKRDGLKAHLQENGIPSVIYYVKPLHAQVAYSHHPRTPTGLKVSEELPNRILCLPMHPYLGEADQDRIIETIRNYIGSNSAQAAAE